ncbi:hypothetical protein POM88_048356 [Heracleum sosnowskyi]|uniref:Uncharacterized protein n=1 Tax=Heracleum sosnowskyi TaxID=360622 RepID=A0AAD8GTP0_9APIA|nr:hypothetical protein POM88_048356 [Heracleum sosnowskyi]
MKGLPKTGEKLIRKTTVSLRRYMHVHVLKRNIGLFSGFVWDVNEEKQRLKVKERIDKCVRDKLLLFCDILNLLVNKSCSKKEDLSVKLLEFLESPHVTTEIFLADIEKAKKLKRKTKSSKSPRSGRKSVKTTSKLKGRICHSGTISMPSSISCLASLKLYEQYFLASSMNGSHKDRLFTEDDKNRSSELFRQEKNASFSRSLECGDGLDHFLIHSRKLAAHHLHLANPF